MKREDLFKNLLGWAMVGLVGLLLYRIFGIVALAVLLVPLLVGVMDRD